MLYKSGASQLSPRLSELASIGDVILMGWSSKKSVFGRMGTGSVLADGSLKRRFFLVCGFSTLSIGGIGIDRIGRNMGRSWVGGGTTMTGSLARRDCTLLFIPRSPVSSHKQLFSSLPGLLGTFLNAFCIERLCLTAFFQDLLWL